MSFLDHFRRCFQYEREMHAAVLRSLDTVPESSRTHEHYQAALDLFGHIAAARLAWLKRFGVAETGPETMFPKGCTPQSIAADLDRMNEGWQAYLESLDEEDLAKDFQYTANDGNQFQNTILDILTQLHGHSLYHRGQIAQRIRQLGGIPAITDFVYWSRIPIQATTGSRDQTDHSVAASATKKHPPRSTRPTPSF